MYNVRHLTLSRELNPAMLTEVGEEVVNEYQLFSTRRTNQTQSESTDTSGPGDCSPLTCACQRCPDCIHQTRLHHTRVRLSDSPPAPVCIFISTLLLNPAERCQKLLPQFHTGWGISAALLITHRGKVWFFKWAMKEKNKRSRFTFLSWKLTYEQE